MLSVGKRITAVALGALLTVSPLLGCTSTAQSSNSADSEAAKQEEMYKEGEETDFKGKTIPYSKQGAYTITLNEGDFLAFEEDTVADSNAAANSNEIDAESNANNASEKQDEQAATNAQALDDAKAELENAKSALDDAQKALEAATQVESQAQTEAKAEEQTATSTDAESKAESDAATAQEKTDAYNKAVEARKQAEEDVAKAEENVKDAEQKVTELEGSANQTDATSSSAEAQENKDKALTFGDLKAEDVKVYYSVMTNWPEVEADETGETMPQYESREAQISSFSNDNGSMTVSFTDPDAASNMTSSYDVTIEALKKYTPIRVEFTQPILTTDSVVASDSESSDVTIKVENDKFAANLSPSNLTLGGSFEGMSVTGAEASGNTLILHLSGTPKLDYDVASVYTDGQITVSASGFENSASDATAFVSVGLPAAAFDLEGAEAMPTASVAGEVDYATIDGDTGKATVYLYADLGDFNDVTPESFTLEDGFAGGKVESVTKEGEDGDVLKVEVSFPANGQTSDDYLLAGTVKLANGAMNDETGNSAPEVETTVAVDSGESMAKDDDAEKKAKDAEKKKKEERSKSLKGYGDGFKYAKGHLKKLDPVLGDIADFCSEAFNLASNLTAGKYVDAIKNVEGLLKLCGIMEPDKKDVTAADVLEEVKSLRRVVDAIDLKVSDISKETRADRFTQTSVRLKKMQDACTSANVMYKAGAELLANRKDNPMKAPAQGASAEEIAKYNAELRALMLQEQEKERKGESKSTMFMDLDKTMTALQDDLSTVSKWVSVDKNAVNAAANPIDVFDKLVSMKFNWDTQGYYARLAFRAELQYTLLNAWAYLSTYYNYADAAVAPKYQPLADGVAEALKQLAARPAGQSPDEVRELNQAGKDIKVYSPSLGITIKHTRKVTGGQPIGDKSIEDVTDDKIKEYKSRMKGTDWEDLELAGLEVGNQSDTYFGLGFRHHVEFHADRSWLMVLTKSQGVSIRETWASILQQKTSDIFYAKTSYQAWQQGGPTLRDDAWYTYYWFDRA